MIHFQCQGQPITLALGQHYAKTTTDGFRDTDTNDLRALIAEIDAGSEWRTVVTRRYANSNPWLLRIIADPIRTSFLDLVVPTTSGLALDIGSGWGQTARALATRQSVVALEPVAERLAFIKAAARQEGIHDNLAYLEADYLEAEFTTRFDLICAIGVLEWVGAFQDQIDPQQRQRDFLIKTRRELSPSGSLVLGIENRLGLKYLLGSPDDHLGVPHVASLPPQIAKSRWANHGHTMRSFTYSQHELTAMLLAAGYTNIEFFAAFPDYKLPVQIISLSDQGHRLHTWLCHQSAPPDHNGYDGSPLASSLQAHITASYHRLATSNLAWPFVPSFFVRAN